MNTQTNAQIIAQTLYEAGVRTVFGQPGGEVVELIEAMAQVGIEFVLMGHESAAALAAGTLGAATGVPGVCLSTLGPGACNLTLGIAEAWLERHPLLALSAHTPEEMSWYNHQQLPLDEMFAPITKALFKLTDHANDFHVKEAIRIALEEPKGPVYLSISGSDAAKPPNPNGISGSSYAPPPETNEEILTHLIKGLNGAKRPFILIGTALHHREDATAVRHFLGASGLPYAETPKAKGVANPNGAGYCGTFVSASGDSVINKRIAECDFVLGIGYDPVETTYDWHLKENYHSIARYDTSFGSFWSHQEVLGDVSEILERVTREYDGTAVWQAKEFAEIRTAVSEAITPPTLKSERGLAPLPVVQTLRNALPDNTQIVVDTGQHKMIAAQAWTTNQPLTLFCSNGLSSMGVGLPGAIGLAHHDRERPVVGLMGDGCLNSMVQELETVQRLGIAPLLVVFCDQSLSLIKIPQQLRGYTQRGVEFAPVDWVKVAEGYGIEGMSVEEVAGAETAVSNWLQTRRALLLTIPIDDALYAGNSY